VVWAVDRNSDAGPQKVARASIRRETGALSTFTGQAELSPLWKHEVSQRVAAHRKRKGSSAADGGLQSHANSSANSRLSTTAARVAARYAAAPSYSDLFAAATNSASTAPKAAPAPEQIMLLDMGITAVPAADPAVQIEQPQLSMVDPAPVAKADWEPDWDFSNDRVAPMQHPLSEALDRESHRGGLSVEEPGSAVASAHAHTPLIPDSRKVEEATWSELAESFYAEAPAASTVNPQPIHGNLIEFPNELVAARKVRPRRAEGIYGTNTEAEPQLSIFEVDPSSISIRPEIAETPAEAPAWAAPEWTDLKLEATQKREPVAEPVAEVRPSRDIPLQAAPMHLRVLAAVVDFGLVSIASVAVAALVAVNATVLPTIREAEIGGGLVFAAIAIVYLAISYMLARATLGMRYALLSLRTFDGQAPTREQRCRRLGAFALSMLPVGLGAVWALFDDEHLAWHDRWSGTYLRRV